MNKSRNGLSMDMCSGPLVGKMISYAIPLVLSGIINRMFVMADSVILGRFAGSDALAAVGSTGSLIAMMTDLFIGLSVGVNIMVSRYCGAGNKKELDDTIHTAITTAILSSIILVLIGVIFAESLLRFMSTPEDIIDKSTLYMRIYFCSMPALMIYNFGSAIIRAFGDSKRPLYYLMAAGAAKTLLSLLFVVVFSMGVGGAALATVISQIFPALLVLFYLTKNNTDTRLNLHRLRMVPNKILQIVSIGVPAGLQAILFSLTNVLIQSSVNSFGSVTVAANSAAVNLENFVYASMEAVTQTAICFSGQNYGARKYKRIGKIAIRSEVMVIAIGFSMGFVMNLFADPLLSLFSTDPEVIALGKVRMSIVCANYFMCGIMNVLAGVLRGIGYSLIPTVISLLGACAVRVLWITFIFDRNRTLECLYQSFPVSWIITIVALFISFVYAYRKLLRKGDSNDDNK